ncbi:hypothetical protein EV176_003322 [Coemansia sp. RSA 451]|nr:hypothetical protein EV176_003322 [Coemansia sp. RSA 451]KAJ2274559.1 hypothetical protein J3F81_002196 [Coemansia sp. RSA 371]
MVTFSSLLESPTAYKAVLVTGCDMYAGYQIALDVLQHKGKHFKCVYAVYFKENDMVHHLKKHGADCIKLAIADGADAIAKAYSKADVVVVLPPVSDDHWGKDSCVFVSAAEKAKIKGLVLCSKINADQLDNLPMLKPLIQMEQAYHDIKGKIKVASLVRCSLHIDMLWLFRDQIASDGKICLPTNGRAKFAPLVESDASHALCRMLIDPNIPAGTYQLTGPEQLDFETVAQHAASKLDEEITFNEIERKDMEQFLKDKVKLCDNHIGYIGDMLEALSKGLLDKCTGDLEQLLGKQPMSVKKYFEKNANDFKP